MAAILKLAKGKGEKDMEKRETKGKKEGDTGFRTWGGIHGKKKEMRQKKRKC